MAIEGFCKLFGSIVTSSVWSEDAETCKVFVTMLALSNRDGFVDATVPGLAALARVPILACQLALDKLSSPDPYSRSKQYEGRRIEPHNGGFVLLNHATYRDKLNEEERREYKRNKESERRERMSRGQNVDKRGQTVDTRGHAWTNVTHTDTDTDTDKNLNTFAQDAKTAAELIYSAYPRKVGKPEALKEIKKAITRLLKGEVLVHLGTISEAGKWLHGRVTRFAASYAGNNGEYTPHPSTWFHQSRYTDDDEAWNRRSGNERRQISKFQEKVRGNREAILNSFRDDDGEEVGRCSDGDGPRDIHPQRGGDKKDTYTGGPTIEGNARKAATGGD